MYDFSTIHQAIDASAAVARSAIVVGNVQIGPESSVWYQAVLRGDIEKIRIGSRTNIQDGCIIHADPGFPCLIGNEVTVGHGAVVHGATVGDKALIGIKSVVLNGAIVGEGAIIGAGCVVPEGFEVPAYSLAIGVPARVVRTLSDDERKRSATSAENYVRRSHSARDSGNF